MLQPGSYSVLVHEKLDWNRICKQLGTVREREKTPEQVLEHAQAHQNLSIFLLSEHGPL